MARIEGKAASGGADVNIVPFTDVAIVFVAHNLGRRPVVQVLQERLDGLYGEGGFGGGGYGSGAGLYTPLPDDVHTVLHVTANSFEVRMSNQFTGEVLYI